MSERITAEIRPVERGDFEALTRFFEENNNPEIVRQFRPFSLSRQEASRIALTSHRDLYCVVIWKSNVVGLCMLRGWDEGFETPSFGVLVDYRYNGLGLGRKMTEFAIAEAKKRGCHSLRLSVYASNMHAVRLYESLGFQEISRERTVIEGEPDIRIVMVRQLVP
jgi:ribosomal protein S18 acetylase RimI-like enzyme